MRGTSRFPFEVRGGFQVHVLMDDICELRADPHGEERKVANALPLTCHIHLIQEAEMDDPGTASGPHRTLPSNNPNALRHTLRSSFDMWSRPAWIRISVTTSRCASRPTPSCDVHARMASSDHSGTSTVNRGPRGGRSDMITFSALQRFVP